jgi:heme ABC exporter ATP-binding subunit CcmA
MTLLEARGIDYRRAGQTILQGVDLTVGPGDSVAIVGPSGSGKTSLLAVLAGLAAPDAGTVRYDDRPVTDTRHHEVALVLQGYGLVSLLTAAENIEVALRSAGAESAAVAEMAVDALSAVELSDRADHLVEELSGGQQQRVAVARALALRPRIIIADEPTAEQDQATRRLVLDRLFDVVRRDGSLILATHDGEVADRCAYRLELSPHA